jgi:hypothetical protein
MRDYFWGLLSNTTANKIATSTPITSQIQIPLSYPALHHPSVSLQCHPVHWLNHLLPHPTV